METDTEHYLRLAERELDIAKLSVDSTTKVLHLNLAAKYATLSDKRTHRALEEPRK
jgi:hypothetical protein